MNVHKWATIECDENETPVEVRIFNGKSTATVPLRDAKIREVKRAIKSLYGIKDIAVVVRLLPDEIKIRSNEDN